MKKQFLHQMLDDAERKINTDPISRGTFGYIPTMTGVFSPPKDMLTQVMLSLVIKEKSKWWKFWK